MNAQIDDRPGADFDPCKDPTHVDGCPGGAGGDHESRPLDVTWCADCDQPAVVNYRDPRGQIRGACESHPVFEAPELPTRAERWVDGYLDRIAAFSSQRDYRGAMKEAQALVLQLHAMALLGREGVDAIPVDAGFTPSGYRLHPSAQAAVDAREAAAAAWAREARERRPIPADVQYHRDREGSWDAPAGAGDAVEADRG